MFPSFHNWTYTALEPPLEQRDKLYIIDIEMVIAMHIRLRAEVGPMIPKMTSRTLDEYELLRTDIDFRKINWPK